MKEFTDAKGDKWSVVINTAAIKRVRDLLKVNLLDAINGDVLVELATDYVMLGDVLFVLCKLEADERGITDEQFGARLGGDTIDEAVTALLEELVSFFPKSRRTILSKALTKLQEAERMGLEAAGRAVDRVDMKAELAKLEAKLSIDGSGNSPESSE